ncbi:MAG: ATP-binding protein [Bacteroidales bacterium]|nr:ATP-binding protein [Bacteroidales bacterium]
MEVKTKYIKSDNIMSVMESASIEVYDSLPLATYDVVPNPATGALQLKEVGDLDNIPEKVYGNVEPTVSRIIETFKYRSPANTGIMLSGLKGTGKTLMTRMISNKAREIGMPTILVNASFQMHSLVQFIKTITVPAVVIFDEFDKTYDASTKKGNDESDSNAQSSLLTLLDGVYSSNKLFIFSLNKVTSVSDYLLSRPGRVFYHYKFDALDPDTVEAVCQDRLANPAFTNDVIMLSHVIKNFTFDILNAIIDECNHYNESPLKFADNLNVSVGIEGYYKFELFDAATGMSLGSANQYVTSDFGRDDIFIPFDKNLYNDPWFSENTDPNEYKVEGKGKGGKKAWKKEFIDRFKATKLYASIPDVMLTNFDTPHWYDGPSTVYMDGSDVMHGAHIRGCASDMDIHVCIPRTAMSSVWKIAAEVCKDGTITTVPLFNGHIVVRMQKQKREEYTAASFAAGLEASMAEGSMGAMPHQGPAAKRHRII